MFTPAFIAGLRPGIEAIATAAIEHPSTETPFDFMADIAQPLPIAVAGAWLDLEAETSKLLREQSPAIIRMLGALAAIDEIESGAATWAGIVPT